MCLGAGVKKTGEIHVAVAQSSAPGIRRIVKMSADGDQAALLPISFGHPVRLRIRQETAGKVGVINTYYCRPVSGLVVNPIDQPWTRAVPEVRELPRQHPVFNMVGGKALKVF